MNANAPVTFLGMLMDRRTRWNFLCEASNAGLVGIFLGITAPFTLPLAIRLGADGLGVWLITAAPFIANLLAPFWARLSHHSRKVPWVVYPHIIWRGGMGLVGLLKSPGAIVGLVLGTQVAVCAGNPAYGAVVQKVYPGPIRGRLMGYIRLTLATCMLPVTLLAGRLMDRFGPVWLYLFAGLMGLTAIGIYSRTKEPEGAPAGPRPGVMAGLKQAVSDSVFARFLLAALLFHGGALTAQPLYALYQVNEMGLSNTQISYLAVAGNLALLIAYAAWGRVIDRKGPRPVVIGAALLYLGLPLAYGLGQGSFALALAGALCQGAADAAMDLGGWNLILSANPERVGPYTSAAMVVTGIRGALGPLLGIKLLPAVGFHSTFLLAAGLVAVGLAVFMVSPRREHVLQPVQG